MLVKEKIRARKHQEYLKNKSKYIERARKWQTQNPQRDKNNHQKWREKNRTKCNQYSMLNFHKNREKWLARMSAYSNIPLGMNCEVCNSTALLERHHPDYAHPEIINTLCKSCHEKKHANLGREVN